MKLFLLLSVTLISQSWASDFKVVNASAFGKGKEISLNVKVDLPDGQKLNSGAPSNVEVFEKIENSKWVSIKKINLKEKVLLEGMDLEFSEPIKLKLENSKVKLKAEIVHCSLNNKGNCYIDTFEKVVSRESASSKQVELTFYPTKG